MNVEIDYSGYGKILRIITSFVAVVIVVSMMIVFFLMPLKNKPSRE
jgi:hypothetical protein